MWNGHILFSPLTFTVVTHSNYFFRCHFLDKGAFESRCEHAIRLRQWVFYYQTAEPTNTLVLHPLLVFCLNHTNNLLIPIWIVRFAFLCTHFCCGHCIPLCIIVAVVFLLFEYISSLLCRTTIKEHRKQGRIKYWRSRTYKSSSTWVWRSTFQVGTPLSPIKLSLRHRPSSPCLRNLSQWDSGPLACFSFISLWKTSRGYQSFQSDR